MFEKDLYRTLARNLPGFGILLFDHTFRYFSVIGDDFLNSSGFTEENIIGKTLYDIDFPGSSYLLEPIFQSALNGETRDMEIVKNDRVIAIRVAPVRSCSGEISSGLVTLQDVTEVVRTREMLESLSLKDELTNIYNRRGFMLLADQQLKIADRSCSGSLLFFIDLNDLKVVNDDIGHSAGDEALKETALVLTSTFRESDIIARYGGDEFIVFVQEATKSQELVIRERLRDVLELFNAKPRKFRLSFSVGCSYYDPDNPKTIDEMIIEADQCMYDYKKSRRKNGSASVAPIRIEPQLTLAKAK